jgi:EPSP synthase (3-phosphoshikimate 1-carboxyvinyltransferase)
LRTELTKCGARVEAVGDTLTVHPGALQGAEIETYNDHRVAMFLAMLGLRVPGIRLRTPVCVRKTFPNFFAKFADLGAVIKDPSGTGTSPEKTCWRSGAGLVQVFLALDCRRNCGLLPQDGAAESRQLPGVPRPWALTHSVRQPVTHLGRTSIRPFQASFAPAR